MDGVVAVAGCKGDLKEDWNSVARFASIGPSDSIVCAENIWSLLEYAENIWSLLEYEHAILLGQQRSCALRSLPAPLVHYGL